MMKQCAGWLTAILLLSSCSIFGDKDSNSLGGSTDVAMAEVGNTVTAGGVTIDGEYHSLGAVLTVTKNESGRVTAELEIDVEALEDQPEVQTLLDYVPDRYKDSQGNISAELEFKVTSEGILDYQYGEPFIMVKYADGVGTKYEIENSLGQKRTREVVGKSTNDDFAYGFMYIKVSTVDMEINSGGIRKLTFKGNHKFGLVHMEATLDDGSTVGSYLYSAATE